MQYLLLCKLFLSENLLVGSGLWVGCFASCNREQTCHDTWSWQHRDFSTMALHRTIQLKEEYMYCLYKKKAI